MDGLRAIACLTVFLANFHHSMGMTVSSRIGSLDLAYFAESGIGVVMLIVLSGSLLSLPFWRRLSAGVHTIPWRQFAQRRAVRLVPAYYACLLLFLGLSGNSPKPLDTTVHFLFVNNLWEPSFYSISPQFWTIGMFAQFYCALPFVFLGLRALRLRGLRAVAAVAIASAGAYLLHWALMATRAHWLVWPISALTTGDGVVLSHSTLAHLPQFLVGVVGGYALWWLRSRDRGVGAGVEIACEVVFWLSAAGAILMASVPALGGLEMPYGRYLFPWTAGFAALAVVTAPFAPLARRLLDAAPLRGLGVISYGVYVYQMACMVAVHRLLRGATFESPSAKLQFAALGLGLTIVVATCSYLALERPLLRWSERRAQR